MRLLTWNLWWRFGEGFEQRQPLIRAALKQARPDIAAFQEVYCEDGEDQLEMLREATGLEGFGSYQSPDSAQRARFGNVLLSRWPLVDPVEIRLPDYDGTTGPRSALIADIDSPGGPITVAATHLDWRYYGSSQRQTQLEVILDVVATRCGEVRTPLLLGDLNAVPESDELRRLTGLAPVFTPHGAPMMFTDSWAAVGEGSGHTWTRENPNSADAAFPRRRLDHVLVGWPRPKPALNPLTAELIGTEPDSEGRLPSDHYGVVVTLDIRAPFPDPRGG